LKLDALVERYPVLLRLRPAEREALERSGRLVEVDEGTQLFTEGDPFDRVYLVLSGEVHCYRQSPDGREQLLRAVAAGSVVCPVPAVDEGPVPDSVRVARKAWLLAIPAAVARSGVRAGTPLGRLLQWEVCQCTRALASRMGVVSLAGVAGRVAAALLALAHYDDLLGVAVPEGGPVPRKAGPVTLNVTHQALAAAAGTSREVVTRTMRRFRKAGLVATGRRQLTLLDPEGLAAVVRAPSAPQA